MINLNKYRKNIYQNFGVNECPHYSEDGVILKIFEEIESTQNPTVVEFGEHRVLGTTTRAFRINYLAKSIYFAGDYNFKSMYLNIFDIIKCTFFKSLKFYKFFFNLPFKYFVTPHNIITLLIKKKVKKIDLFCVDIDSYDYFIAEKILDSKFAPTLFIIEYNSNLPIESKLTLTYEDERKNFNKRIYGASFLALKNLFLKYNYKLIHISGFCNLFFINEKYADRFSEPNYINDIPKNDEEAQEFIDNFCQKSFITSWYGEKYLDKDDLKEFKEV